MDSLPSRAQRIFVSFFVFFLACSRIVALAFYFRSIIIFAPLYFKRKQKD